MGAVFCLFIIIAKIIFVGGSKFIRFFGAGAIDFFYFYVIMNI